MKKSMFDLRTPVQILRLLLGPYPTHPFHIGGPKIGQVKRYVLGLDTPRGFLQEKHKEYVAKTASKSL